MLLHSPRPTDADGTLLFVRHSGERRNPVVSLSGCQMLPQRGCRVGDPGLRRDDDLQALIRNRHQDSMMAEAATATSVSDGDWCHQTYGFSWRIAA